MKTFVFFSQALFDILFTKLEFYVIRRENYEYSTKHLKIFIKLERISEMFTDFLFILTEYLTCILRLSVLTKISLDATR